jgi:Flp pilus assembly protein TadB
MSNNFIARSLITLAVAGVFAVGIAGSALADTPWQKAHPRREQVNNRLNRQNARIHREVKEGELTRQQARQLHAQDHQIRQEERGMASQNGGHITKLEQATLNQQENHLSGEIGR